MATDQRMSIIRYLQKMRRGSHHFGKKVLSGIVMAYALFAGGIWKVDILAGDVQEEQNLDASETLVKGVDEKRSSSNTRRQMVYSLAQMVPSS